MNEIHHFSRLNKIADEHNLTMDDLRTIINYLKKKKIIIRITDRKSPRELIKLKMKINFVKKIAKSLRSRVVAGDTNMTLMASLVRYIKDMESYAKKKLDVNNKRPKTI